MLIEYLVDFMNAYRRQGEYVLQQVQWKNVSSLTLMSKGEKGVKESSSNISVTDQSLNGRMQRRVESECKCCHQCQRGRLLAISAIRKQISVYLSLMARTCGRSDENSIE